MDVKAEARIKIVAQSPLVIVPIKDGESPHGFLPDGGNFGASVKVAGLADSDGNRKIYQALLAMRIDQ